MNVKKLILLSFILLFEMGCEEIEVCNPDRLHPESQDVTRKFNGNVYTTKDAMRPDIDFVINEIKDGVVIPKQVQLSPRGTNQYDHFDLTDFPNVENQEKTYPLKMEVKPNYYSFSNTNTGTTSYFVPVSDSYNYQGWIDDRTALFQHGYYNNGYESDHEVDQILFEVQDTDDASFKTSAYMGMQKSAITEFPDVSPNGDLQVNLTTIKTWTGKLHVKITKNSNSLFEMKTQLFLTDGKNTLEQELNENYSMLLAECHKEWRE